MLAEAAEVITRTLRSVDLAFRYGGDEFVAVLPQTSGSSAAKAANRLLVALRARRFLSLEDSPCGSLPAWAWPAIPTTQTTPPRSSNAPTSACIW